jgi:hypothetical protein
MKMKRIFFLVAILCSICSSSFSQNTKESVLSKATADSSYFAINKKAGWQQYSSQLTPVNTDSVMIEMIVQHDKAIDWKQEQPVGKIKSNSLLPKARQIIAFNLLTNIYQMRIEPNGKCYLRLISGSLPEGDPVIIIIQGNYKRK